MNRRLLFAAALLSLKPFTTNFCTGFPDGTLSEPHLWRHCCALHDLAFWGGGCRGARDEADLELKNCVSASGAPAIAELMYLGVRLGAHSPIKIPNERWGNGWVNQGSSGESCNRDDYRPLSINDYQAIDTELSLHPPKEIEAGPLRAYLAALRSQIKEPPRCEQQEN